MSLTDKYWAEHGLAGFAVEAFLDKVIQGDYGSYSRNDIIMFLAEMEAGIVHNIETKAGEAPGFAYMKADVIADTEERFRKLRATYAP